MTKQDVTLAVPAEPVPRSPTGPPPPVPASSNLSGYTLGNYQIIGLLGHGGMGMVYEAWQENPRRRVALKVLSPGLASPALLRRFEHEAEILGRLHHPGIAQIHEAGSFDLGAGPQPFFAMELVEGLSLSEHNATSRLSVEQRLRLLVRICHAIQHAHQRGVIHRDLKPANILVQSEPDGPGLPKVLDFGIARATDDDAMPHSRFTGDGQMLGTLSYMSPEQARGDSNLVDTRSDVYSLGVIAYELLAGRLPWQLDTLPMHEAVRTLCEIDAPRLSSISTQFRGDMELIVSTALAKDPARRYQSALELAADIERLLDSRPILARAPSAGYRIARFVHRNRVLAGATVLLFLALSAGLVASSAMYLRAEQHRLLAEQQAVQMEQVAALQAAQLSGINVAALGQDLRMGLLHRALAAAERSGIDGPGLAARQEALTQLLEGTDFAGLAMEALDLHLLKPTLVAIDRDLPGQPLVQARLLESVATAYRDLGRRADADAPQRRALDLRTEELGAEHPLTLGSASALVQLLDQAGRSLEAEPIAVRVLEARQRTLGKDHADTDLARVTLGGVLLNQGRVAESLPLLTEAVVGLRQHLGPDHRDTLNALNSLGMAYAISDDYASAEPLLLEALQRFRSIGGEEDPSTLRALNNLGYVYDLMENYQQAEALYRSALETRTRVSGNDHPETLTAMNNLGFALSGLGRADEAESYYRSSLEGRRRVLGDEHPDTIASMSNFGVVLRERGRLDEAAELGATAVTLARRALPEAHWHLGVFLGHHGVALTALDQYAEAEARLLESQRIIEAALGAEHPRHQAAVEYLVALYQRWHERGGSDSAQAQAAQWQTRLTATSGP